MKNIGLIKKAHELGLCRITKHPMTKERVILPPDQDSTILTDEWEELQAFVNNRRNIKLKIQVDQEGKLKTQKPKEVKK